MNKLFLVSLISLSFSCSQDSDTQPRKLGDWPVNGGISIKDVENPEGAKLAPTTENMLECTQKEDGNNTCKFTQNMVADKQETLSLFKGTYKYDCWGDYVQLTISSENSGVNMQRSTETLEFSIYGYGPLQILETGSLKLDSANLLGAPTCSVQVEVTDIQPAI